MTLRLYSTLSRTVERFRPAGDVVRMYVCGVTPYDTTHLGHAFCYVAFDVLGRYLRFLGHRVRYIQNITDIDNDILRKAAETGERWDELGNGNVEIHQRSLAALNVEPPEAWPRATEAIPSIVEITADLIRRGCAYEVDGNVYFRTASTPTYGELSRLTPDEMAPILTKTGDPADDPRKERPIDFLLWQAAKPGEPTWPSPWGPGRPGWHIECSAMAIDQLGETIDIHGGGGDLVYPHHESEIVQSECWTGRRPFARFWMHAGMLRMDGEKMSKSLGNMVFVEPLLREHSPEAIRLYLSSIRYRGVLDYDEQAVRATEDLVTLLRRAAEGDDGRRTTDDGPELDAGPYRSRFVEAMDDDLDTPTAIEALHDLAEAILAARARGQATEAATAELRTLTGVLGLSFSDAAPAAS